ncbi:MAG: hypothetical protein M0Z39_11560 [Actinomycetota bacterium]|jgi:hypothetical protein|nr:hypothetical protein [Actinomycetota bacterium]
MAELVREDGALVLKLSTIEKAESVHGDITVPLSSVQEITVVDDIIRAVHGIKLPGSRIPGIFAMGTFLSGTEKIFAIVHHQNQRGVKVRLQSETFDTLLVGADNPEKLVESLGY